MADRALVETFVWMKSKGYRPTQFWETWADACSLIMPRDAVARLLAVPEDASWLTEKENVNLVVGSSALGKKWFGHAALECLSDTIGDQIDKALFDKFDKLEEVTEEVRQQARSEVETMAAEYCGGVSMDHERVICVNCWHAKLKLKVK